MTPLTITKAGLILLMGGAGSLARYLVGGWVQKLGAGFPWGTLFINISGCFIIGFLSAAFQGRWLVREEYRVALTVGFLGGYTTFSTFGLETFRFVNDAQFFRASMNVLLSVVVGLAAVWAGYRLAENWLGA
ncbi:MAG: fluoride efflux transporter CrcB [Tepidisphaerales bacterium]